MPAPRYAIAELYGKSLADLPIEERQALLDPHAGARDCRFRGATCNKAGGVCTMRLVADERGFAVPINEQLVTFCPRRFLDEGTVFRWVGETLIGTAEPSIIKEVPFLSSEVPDLSSDNEGDAVGMIDMVLVNPESKPMLWCALEMQSVYFSGRSMRSQFDALREWKKEGVPFPDQARRPDFRSSGPKRLMPQLQIKVPTLRRWGKKMAIVVDRAFRQSLGQMETVGDISNCDVVWFVVDYEKSANGFRLVRGDVELTTLDRAVEGLTNGCPVPLATFESRLASKLDLHPPRKGRAR